MKTPSTSDGFSNAGFIDALLNSGDGQVKQASAGASDYIRDHLKESAVFPNILPPVNKNYDQLIYYPGGDELGVVVDEYEPGCASSVSVPFGGSAASIQFRGIRFTTSFGKEVTAEYSKLIDELAGYSMDLRQVVTDNALKEMDNAQDGTFFASIDTLVGPVTGVGLSGVQQHFQYTGQVSRRSYADSINNLARLDVPQGVWVIADTTANEWIGMGRDEWGDDFAGEVFRKGLSGAMSKLELVGVPHIATIKRHLVPHRRTYQFTTPQFMGRHYILQGVQMYVERKDDMVRWYATRKSGCSIANFRAATVQDWV